mmetsp:Transcript_21414/g.33814  ORF Transcript_21414/g.33814 Transcript_21414/m.33814 type:complete len:234 (+) Transcript_21414:700-1401(+)
MVHVLAGFDISFLVRHREIVEQELDGFDRMRFSKLVRSHRDESLCRVRDGVDTRVGHERFGKLVTKRRVYDCNIGCELVGEDRVFHSVIVRNHSKRSNLRGSSRGCGNTDQAVNLRPQLGKWRCPLANFNESRCCVLHVKFRMLIDHPNELSRIHGRPTAEADDHVWLEGLTGFHTGVHRLHVWVGLNLVKHLDRKTLGLEDITDPGGLSKADHRMVCDYQAPLISRTVGVHI